MKVSELFFVEKQLIAPNDYDRRGTPMKLPNMFNNIDYGKKQKVTPQTVTIKSSGKDHKVYGRKTIAQK